MSYATTNPPSLITPAPLTGAGGIWYYTSADAIATVNTTGYITNGGDLGMRVGDTVIVYDTATPLTSMTRVVTVSSTAPGAVNLADGVSLGTDGD